MGRTTRAIEVAACVESQPTTWNEVKQEASEILDEARKVVSTEEAQKGERLGAEMDMEALRKQLLKDEIFM
jgi:hypothetical protein